MVVRGGRIGEGRRGGAALSVKFVAAVFVTRAVMIA